MELPEEEAVVAFVRRKGNSFYLVHNVRRQGKVQQLHLARLGERIAAGLAECAEEPE